MNDDCIQIVKDILNEGHEMFLVDANSYQILYKWRLKEAVSKQIIDRVTDLFIEGMVYEMSYDKKTLTVAFFNKHLNTPKQQPKEGLFSFFNRRKA